MQQCGTQALGIGARYQPTALDIRGQYLGGLELHQLIGCTLRARDAQLVEYAIDLIQCEVVQHIVEKLWQAETHLATDREASNCLALQSRLIQFAAARIRLR